MSKGKDFEGYVKFVYSTLLNLEDEGVVVSSNAMLVGRSGAKHEIDVFYQFERTGTLHKVAIECKFTARPVEKSQITDFHSKLNDIGNIQGFFVSKSGYQQGAKDYGKHYGIDLLGIDDLPTLNVLVGETIGSIALPKESYIGEPFWSIMEITNGELTGNYWSQKQKILNYEEVVPLFLSKNDALLCLGNIPDKENYVVRGIPQRTLRMLIVTTKMSRGRVGFSLMLAGEDEGGMWPGVITSPDSLERRFLIKPLGNEERLTEYSSAF